MRSVGLLFVCLCVSYVFIRGLLGTAVDVINWLIRLSAENEEL